MTFDEREGAHPFTISSAWQGDGRLLFLIKALGDYTRTLASSLKAGDAVTVEGPTAASTSRARPGARSGSAAASASPPFVACLHQLAQQSDGRQIDLFHATTEVDETRCSGCARMPRRPACACTCWSAVAMSA